MSNKIKRKIAAIITILALMAGVLSFFLISPDAQAVSLGPLEDLFDSGDQGLSFVQYEGGIAELNDQGYDQSLVTSNDARDFILRIVDFALGFLGLAAVIVIIYAGVLYVTAGGETDKTDKAKKAITYATIGLIIVMGSFAFVNTIIRGASGGDGSGGQYVVGPNQGGSFNASASEVRSVARQIYSEYLLFAEVFEEIKNIEADLADPSLDYQSALVAKENMLIFLNSTKAKALNIRSRVPQFSEMYTTINIFNRELDRHIANINVLNQTAWYEFNDQGEIIGECESDSASAIVCVNGYIPYVRDLQETWNDIKAELQSPDDQNPSSVRSLLEPMRNDFIQSFDQQVAAIAAIHSQLIGIQAAQEGSIGALYTRMSNQLTEFRSAIESWNITDDATQIDRAGGLLFEALTTQLEYSDALSSLQSVIARLRADVVTGNAPLFVTFDVLESIDPAGGSIVDVDWTRIEGNYTRDGEQIQDVPADAVNCFDTEQLRQVNSNQEITGATFRQCVFNHPGTYVATVLINSNDPTQYVSGISSLVIKVNPPTTKINLTTEFAGKEIPVIEYYDNGIIKLNRDRIPVTLDEAQAGITFNASNTENVQTYRWDFGDGDIREGQNESSPVKTYEAEGNYLVTLEVTNQLNQIDRKIFTVEVGSVAGRITLSPASDIYINTPVRISAEQSAAAGGDIRGYQWSITPDGGEPFDLGANISRSSFSYEFDNPGVYDIDLLVTGSVRSGAAPTVTINVKSQSPVAKIKSEIPQTNKPNYLHLSGSSSFDPDGDNEDLIYEWKINPDSDNGRNWEVVEGAAVNGVITERDPVIKFNKVGDYDISLKVTDQNTIAADIEPEFGEASEQVTIDSVLDLDWDPNQEVTALVNEQGFADINFDIISENAVAYEIDFGDDNTTSGNIDQLIRVPHTYASAGRYDVEVTVYDSDDNDNSMSRRFFIGGGDTPVARASLLVNGNEIFDLSEPVKVNTSDLLTFDASQSKNTDGTGRNLNYQWTFGDTERSSKKRENHRYRELSPPAGFYTVTLTTIDDDDPSKFDTDEIYIDVINEPPFFSSVQGVVSENVEGRLTTPVQVDMRVYGAEDTDGSIVQYKWWYFDVDDPTEPLGIQITDSPVTSLTIGTHGQTGQTLDYGFGLEITDNDGLTYSNLEEIDQGNFSQIQVINGENVLPQAQFNVNNTSVFVGDQVVFTSSSTDPDGQIDRYIWDLEGDGFFNNIPTKDSSISYSYPSKNLDGYKVRLKVIDDKGGESVSDPVTVFVDSNAAPPTAAFKYNVVAGSKGMKVQFTNNSTVDTEAGAELLSYRWDFDTASQLPTADSNGDGEKNNDIDSREENPDLLYTVANSYQVSLTVTDNQGNSDTVVNTVTIPLANPPTAAFKYRNIDGKLVFENNSVADTSNDATLEKYIWDFDVDSELDTADSDGDGNIENDIDSELKSPVHIYDLAGTYQVKLTVIDNQGNEDFVINPVTFSPGLNDGLGSIGSVDNTPSNIKAILLTNPEPSDDGNLYLNQDAGQVRFNYSQSLGDIAFFVIDKNILFDTNGDGITDNDEDFKTVLPGSWTTNFESTWGKIVARLTVADQNGNTDSQDIEIIFQ